MGAASEHRGNKAIRRALEDEKRPVEFEIMDRLNGLEKYPDAGTPFTPVRIGEGHNGFWIYCPKTGFGYWYKTLAECVRRWQVTLVGFDGEWIAEPIKLARFAG